MSDAVEEILYVSWGGSGRGAALRAAHGLAADGGRGFVYLAVLDAANFSDIDDNLRQLVVEELTWLLETQLALVHNEHRGTEVPTRLVIRAGDVVEEVVDLVEALGTELVLVGAPIPAARQESVDEMIEALAQRTGATISLVGQP